MSSVVEACGSRIASACSSDSATSCCMVARSSLLRLRLRRIFGLGLETCVPQKVCKQRPQAICIPQVFGVLTEACLASSHFFRTSSQCGAAQGKEPVKTGKRWTQPQHLRKVSLLAARHFCTLAFQQALKNEDQMNGAPWAQNISKLPTQRPTGFVTSSASPVASASPIVSKSCRCASWRLTSVGAGLQTTDWRNLKTRFQRCKSTHRPQEDRQKESWTKKQSWYSHLVHLHFRLSVCQVAKLAIFPLSTIAVEEADAKTATNLKWGPAGRLNVVS